MHVLWALLICVAIFAVGVVIGVVARHIKEHEERAEYWGGRYGGIKVFMSGAATVYPPVHQEWMDYLEETFKKDMREMNYAHADETATVMLIHSEMRKKEAWAALTEQQREDKIRAFGPVLHGNYEGKMN
ncbi:MAG: hypothetical protein JKY23_06640 [Nitrospinaceae bacterium]|nr:hypothetical protein [Nitrospinaceae bacterium]